MTQQNYSNHTRVVTGFHRVLLPLLLLLLIGSGVNIWLAVKHENGRLTAVLVLLLSVAVVLASLFARMFAVRAQDRAIRAEENLRHFAMTGRLLDPRITIQQAIALRFASDAEFVALAEQAAAGSMTPDAIKRAVRTWRADNWRV